MFDVQQLYLDKYREFGATPEGMFWNGKESQELRFALIAKLLHEKRVSIGDFGCGDAALYRYLGAQGYDVYEYHGVDTNKEVLEFDRKMYPEETLQFSVGAFTKKDYWVVSGTFNLRGATPEGIWADWVKATLYRLKGMARKGVIFNVLDKDSCAWFKDTLFYVSVAEAETWFSNSGCEVERDMRLREFTMLVLTGE